MPEQEKTAAEQKAIEEARAFEVGIAHLCKDGGFRYAELAKRAGQTEQSLGPELQMQMQKAAAELEAQPTT